MLTGDFALHLFFHATLHKLPSEVSPDLPLTEKSAASQRINCIGGLQQPVH